ncbi:hypothetical protein SAMN05216283_103206 [Sunxiuqinia elliptica]|uniref:Uncharacterized protein n=1 Tax=Sunxiuqinia elliptica TaxID=655355 RepID=A0A1I2H1B9_9BACT|nr:hypothetical protein SAMN05216283_103206 [Sunxiuqinia elliptica]
MYEMLFAETGHEAKGEFNSGLRNSYTIGFQLLRVTECE